MNKLLLKLYSDIVESKSHNFKEGDKFDGPSYREGVYDTLKLLNENPNFMVAFDKQINTSDSLTSWDNMPKLTIDK